jgi:hypothetical protein
MTLGIVLMSIAIAAILERQQLRHRAQVVRVYGFLRRVPPPERPAAPLPETLLLIYLGLVFVGLGLANIVVILDVPAGFQISDWGNFLAALIGAGVAMVVRGAGQLREKRRGEAISHGHGWVRTTGRSSVVV